MGNYFSITYVHDSFPLLSHEIRSKHWLYRLNRCCPKRFKARLFGAFMYLPVTTITFDNYRVGSLVLKSSSNNFTTFNNRKNLFYSMCVYVSLKIVTLLTSPPLPMGDDKLFIWTTHRILGFGVSDVSSYRIIRFQDYTKKGGGFKHKLN